MSDDLNANPKDNSEIKIIANIFSIYRYGAVKKELSKISGLRRHPGRKLAGDSLFFTFWRQRQKRRRLFHVFHEFFVIAPFF